MTDPGPDRIHTIRLRSGDRYRLSGMHILTKELRHWLWITLWWSDRPDTDFGADRPAFIQGVWRHYKMCVVTDFAEQDPDPAGGFGRTAPSLGAALAAVHGGAGGPTLCSNPYIELGPGVARTNCIGCHQHGGTGADPHRIVSDPVAFPANGRARVRVNFPTDYSWTFDRGDGLATLLQDTIERYATSDR
jgi:hypothetical protein